MDSLLGTDRVSISRSAAWIAEALRDDSLAQRFLLLFLSIEALATYIENRSEQSSPLFQFAGDRLTKPQRKQRREKCIADVLASGLEPREAIQKAYFECVVGTRRMLEEHLTRVFGNGQASSALFYEENGGKTLWTLRNDIAHGSLNLLEQSDIKLVADQVHVLEEIARSYLRTILARLAKLNYFPMSHLPILTLPASHGIGSANTQYMGPTDMAEYYANVEALNSSFIRFEF